MLINATHLGARLNGIGRYILSLLDEWTRMPTPLSFEVYLHESARPHVEPIDFPPHFALHWVTSHQFADGDNVRRLLFANRLAVSRPREILFNPSQLEVTFCGARQILTVHDLIPLQFRHSPQRNQRFFFRYAARPGIARSAALITGSSATAAALHSVYGIPERRISVIPYGARRMEEKTTAAVRPAHRNYILYAGRMAAHRNLDCLVDAFARIQDRVPHDLLLVGERTSEWSLPPGASPRIHVLGHLSDAEVAELYRGASVFVFPSVAEGFGLTPLEAMASGCPVVAVRASSLPEVCGSAALLVDADSVTALADGMIAVLQDPMLRSQLVDAGLKRAAELTWRKCATAHLRLFEAVAGES